MAKEETKDIVETKPVDVEAFIERKLKAINTMKNKAKAKALAERVMKNR